MVGRRRFRLALGIMMCLIVVYGFSFLFVGKYVHITGSEIPRLQWGFFFSRSRSTNLLLYYCYWPLARYVEGRDSWAFIDDAEDVPGGMLIEYVVHPPGLPDSISDDGS